MQKFQLPPMTDKNLMRYTAVILIAVFFLCFYITRITEGPEHAYLKQLGSQLSELKQKMYDNAAGYSLISEEEQKELKKLKEDAEGLSAEAEALWASIPVGEVVAKDGVGGYRTVGKNKEVQALRSKAAGKKASLKNRQLSLGLKYGPVLLAKYDLYFWREYQHIQDSIEWIKEAHGWYYKSWLGGLIKFIHGLAALIAIISGPLAILVVINVVFSLFSE